MTESKTRGGQLPQARSLLGSVPWAFVLRLAISAILLSWVFTKQADIATAWQSLRHARWGYVLGGFFLFFIGELLTVYKWQLLLRVLGARCSFVSLTRAMLVGEFYSMFLPTSVGGDIARIALTRSAAGGTSPAASAALMQRNTGLGGLLILAIMGTTLAPVRLGLFSGPMAWLDELRIWFLAIGFAYICINVVLLSERAYAILWRRYKSLQHEKGIWARAVNFADRFHASSGHMRRVFALALVVSCATQFLDCLMGWCAARAVGTSLSVAEACVFVPAATLTALLPISVNGIGVREAAYVTLTKHAGLTAEQAVALSVIHFACLVLLALIGGIWHLLQPQAVAREFSDETS